MSHINIDELDPSGDIRTIADDAGALDPTGATRRGLMKRGVVGAGGFVAASTMLGMLSPMEAFAAASSAQKGAYSRNAPIKRKGKPTANDVKIGNYALTLEYIEAAFYALADQANFPDADIAAAAKVLATHEAAHVKALKGILGKAAVKTPAFNTDTVGKLLADQITFIRTAAAVEPVGTAAYAGAGPYISNLAIVKAALSIHSVEAQHAAYTAALALQKGATQDINGVALNPVPNIVNPAFSFKKTVGIVTSLDVVTGPLQP